MTRALTALNRAKDYWAAANCISAVSTEGDGVNLFLPAAQHYQFAIEIALKAVMLGARKEPPNGHDIDIYLVKCIGLGLKVQRATAASVFKMGRGYAKHAARYALLGIHTLTLPPLGELRTTSAVIVRQCEQFLTLGYDGDLVNDLSHADAERLRVLVCEKIAADDTEFDPYIVTSEVDPLGKSLGSVTFVPFQR